MNRRQMIAIGTASAAAAVLPSRLLADDTSQRIVATGLKFPEGPAILKDSSLLFVEIDGHCLSRLWPDGRVTKVADLGGGPNGCAVGPDNAAYVANDGGLAFRTVDGRTMVAGVPSTYVGGSIQRVDLATGKFRTLYDAVGNNRLKGPNDIVFDGWGGFWFTDTGKGYARTRDHGGLYWGKADGSELREIAYPLLTPNGIALGADRRTLYVALSEKRQIIAYTLTGPGQVESVGGVPKTRLVASLGGDLSIDNIAVEESGNLVLAAVRQGAILTVNPAGEVIETVKLPDPIVTAMAFGGTDRRTLYVTLSGTGQIAALKWPRAGLKPAFSA